MDSFYRHNFSYITRGYYVSQIKEFLKYFPRENMFFVIFEEDFLKNRGNLIKELLQFLDVDTKNVQLNINIKSNAATLPKVSFIQNVIYDPNNILKKIGKVILPNKKIRMNIIKYLDKKNQKTFDPPLSRSLRKYIIETYFYKEIRELEKLINKNLSIWYKQ